MHVDCVKYFGIAHIFRATRLWFLVIGRETEQFSSRPQTIEFLRLSAASHVSVLCVSTFPSCKEITLLRKNICFIHCWDFLFSLFLYLPITLYSSCLWRWWDFGGIIGLVREGWWHMWLCKANQALPSLLVFQPDSCQRVPERSQRGYTCVWNSQNRKFSGLTNQINASLTCYKPHSAPNWHLFYHKIEMKFCFVMHIVGFIANNCLCILSLKYSTSLNPTLLTQYAALEMGHITGVNGLWTPFMITLNI